MIFGQKRFYESIGDKRGEKHRIIYNEEFDPGSG